MLCCFGASANASAVTGTQAAGAARPWIAAASAAVIDYVHVDGFEAVFDCSLELACAAPAAGKACVAGRIGEAGTGRPLRAFFHADRACADGAIGGACNLRLAAYDALDLAANPGAAAELPAMVHLDGCARFRISDLTPPALGFVAIVADDADPVSESDLHAPSARMLPVAANAQVENLEFLAARQDSVARWTSSAGSPFGTGSFADAGAMLFHFVSPQGPEPGVTVVRDGSAMPANDYYFADSVSTQRSLVDSGRSATGVNGSALVVFGPMSNYSGNGGGPVGCVWQEAPSASIAGYIVFVPIGC